MLPYTPLHLLLLEPEEGFPDIFVMTSANISEEPIAYTNNDAISRLNGIADGFLMHDRTIHMRIDDSVISSFAIKPISHAVHAGLPATYLPAAPCSYAARCRG